MVWAPRDTIPTLIMQKSIIVTQSLTGAKNCRKKPALNSFFEFLMTMGIDVAKIVQIIRNFDFG